MDWFDLPESSEPVRKVQQRSRFVHFMLYPQCYMTPTQYDILMKMVRIDLLIMAIYALKAACIW